MHIPTDVTGNNTGAIKFAADELPVDHDLLFQKPVFEESKTQMTCRLGPKWYNRLSRGDILRLKEKDGPVYGKAIVEGVCLAPFKDLPESWIEREHLPNGRTPEGLAEIMRDIYGERFQPNQPCTAIYLYILKFDSTTHE